MTPPVDKDSPPCRPAALAVAGLCLVLALLAAVAGGRVVALDLDYTRLRTEVGFWGRDGYRPPQATLERTAAALERLVERAPGQPDYRALQASALSWQAYYSADYELTVALANRALAAQLAAQRLRPAHRHGWTKVVEYASRATEGAPVMEQSRARLELLHIPAG